LVNAFFAGMLFPTYSNAGIKSMAFKMIVILFFGVPFILAGMMFKYGKVTVNG